MKNNLSPFNKDTPFSEFWSSLSVKDYGVYRLYDSENTLLYVGITRALRRRIKQHYLKTRWIKNATRLEFEHGFTEREARVKEGEYIGNLNPEHNKLVPATRSKIGQRRPPGVKKMPKVRREIALAALSGESKTLIAARFNISRQSVYDLERWARQNVEAELKFWKKFSEISG